LEKKNDQACLQSICFCHASFANARGSGIFSEFADEMLGEQPPVRARINMAAMGGK
jgi:hypothetical protein